MNLMVKPYKTGLGSVSRSCFPQGNNVTVAILILLSTGKWNMIPFAGDIVKK